MKKRGEQSLYAKLKDDVQLVSEPLFEASQLFIRRRGDFLPHGAVLTARRKIKLVMAVPDLDRDLLYSKEVLPVLHKALRSEKNVRAVAVCEHVKITLVGKKQTAAIKVLVEHARGLCAALYLPFRRTAPRKYKFGEIFVIPAKPEVRIRPSYRAPA